MQFVPTFFEGADLGHWIRDCVFSNQDLFSFTLLKRTERKVELTVC